MGLHTHKNLIGVSICSVNMHTAHAVLVRVYRVRINTCTRTHTAYEINNSIPSFLFNYTRLFISPGIQFRSQNGIILLRQLEQFNSNYVYNDVT